MPPIPIFSLSPQGEMPPTPIFSPLRGEMPQAEGGTPAAQDSR